MTCDVGHFALARLISMPIFSKVDFGLDGSSTMVPHSSRQRRRAHDTTMTSTTTTPTYTLLMPPFIDFDSSLSLFTSSLSHDIVVKRFLCFQFNMSSRISSVSAVCLTLSPMASCFYLSLLLPILLSIFPVLSANSEGNVLYALRSRLHDPANVLQSWNPSLVNPCTWFHVTCDSSNHVVRLDLGNSNISGTLGPELGQLKHLQYLELYRNNIGGKIPKELGSLKNLLSMDLYENRFEGNIPKSFAKLKSLRFLRLNNNKLTGPIPRELTALSNLKVFDVSNNDLCGTIPVDGPFGSFPMESFEHNRLNGPELQGLVSYDFGC